MFSSNLDLTILLTEDIWFVFRYCYLLNDLTPDLLRNECPDYEGLRSYLRLRGKEAYLQKRVSRQLLLVVILFYFKFLG